MKRKDRSLKIRFARKEEVEKRQRALIALCVSSLLDTDYIPIPQQYCCSLILRCGHPSVAVLNMIYISKFKFKPCNSNVRQMLELICDIVCILEI